MSKRLVLAEKPSVARDLARVLKCHKKGNGYLEGTDYIVTWALGHLVTLAAPEKYHAKYKTWRIEDLPMLPTHLELEVIPKTSKQFHSVKQQLLRKDVHEIIIATDAGREGELVARWILDKALVKKPVKRLWISSVTDRAIKEGFQKLQPGKKYEPLYASAVARSAADWYVGLNATRALTCKYNAQLSCGRVQTPTLAIIATREDLIQNFKPQPFYGIQAVAKSVTFTWQDKKTQLNRLFDKQKCQSLLEAMSKHPLVLTDVVKTKKKSYPPKLYDLTELQRDANKIYHFSAKETLSLMQNLYERHKLLTYPRTDSRYLTRDMVDTLKDRIKACGIGSYASIARPLLLKPIQGHSSYVDDQKVSDHHAIIPTEEPVFLNKLNDKERKIYDLVVQRFFAVLYPPYEYEQTTFTATVGSETLTAGGQIVLSKGWKVIYSDLEEDNKTLPSFNKGDTLPITTLTMTEGYTQPPAYFNEGTLLTAMENPTKYMDTKDKDLIKTLDATGGLGTVATRADIIEKLFNSFLIEKKETSIHITSKGRQLLELVPDDLKSPILTAKWEQKLDAIAKNQLDADTFINTMKDYTKKVVADIKKNEAKFKHTNVTGDRCPECGKFMLEVNGKKGKLLICQDRQCGYKKPLAKVTNARCPNCHKKLQLVGEGEGQRFVCVCGYREKLATFKERKETRGKNVSKRDVQNYLKTQKKEEPAINTAFADALKHLKK